MLNYLRLPQLVQLNGECNLHVEQWKNSYLY